MTQRRTDDERDRDDDLPEWADQVMATVAAEVRRLRKELGMSAQDLADACADLGHPIPRNVIANMESGRRSTLPLVDVLVLAAALDAPPVLLLYPLGYVSHVQKLPLADPIGTWDALRWFTGEKGDSFAMHNPMLRNFRAHEHHEAAALTAERDAEYARWQARTANTPEKREDAQREAEYYADKGVHHRDRLRTARALIEEDGGTPPPLTRQLHGDLDTAQSEERP
ncbi:helix-turn-helix domain-containing protein [Streptomyces sp. NPDC006925]|uniref:helix-turn-helix domain-containing protein n=1 Tax=Streptomyces sp. NPDC006925 TaxID=3364768 RepID=UPI0036A22AC0